MLESYQAVLCLNGTIPGAAFWSRVPRGLDCFACDGAATQIHAVGGNMRAILGDGDSIGGLEAWRTLRLQSSAGNAKSCFFTWTVFPMLSR